jgi:hypothetical protein
MADVIRTANLDDQLGIDVISVSGGTSDTYVIPPIYLSLYHCFKQTLCVLCCCGMSRSSSGGGNAGAVAGAVIGVIGTLLSLSPSLLDTTLP